MSFMDSIQVKLCRKKTGPNFQINQISKWGKQQYDPFLKFGNLANLEIWSFPFPKAVAS